jgi:hypothetical protein
MFRALEAAGCTELCTEFKEKFKVHDGKPAVSRGFSQGSKDWS